MRWSYSTPTGTLWSGGVDDRRTCGACQCAGGYGTCNNATIQLYNSANCTGNPISVAGVDGDQCALAFAPASGRIGGVPVPTACVANLYPNGTIKEADFSSVCCE